MVDKLSLYGVGDVAAFRENPETMFTYTASILNQADILFFNNERHYTTRGTLMPQESHTEVVPPEQAQTLKAVKFDVASMAMNHAMDLGFDALSDTCNVLKQMGMQVIGAGKNIAEARKPAIIERKGTKVGFLAYVSNIREGFEAGLNKPGVAPMRAWTIYEPFHSYRGGSPVLKIHTFPNREHLAALVEDVRKLRPLVDVLVLSFHWGSSFVPVVLVDYQRDVAHAAIDAGADLILGHGPHVLKGIEVYKGKAVFYSMGSFAFDVTVKVRQEWEKARPEHEQRDVRNFYRLEDQIEPGWLDSKFAYPPEFRKTMIVKCIISDKNIEKVSFLPVLINKQAQPIVITREDENFNEIMSYVAKISKDQGLDIELLAEGDEVVVRT